MSSESSEHLHSFKKNYLSVTISIFSWTVLSYSDSRTLFRRLYSYFIIFTYILSAAYVALLSFNVYHSTGMSWTNSAACIIGIVSVWCMIISVSVKRNDIMELIVRLNTVSAEMESKFYMPQYISIDKIERINATVIKSLIFGTTPIAILLSSGELSEVILTGGNTTGTIHHPGGATSSRIWVPFDISSIYYCIMFFLFESVNLIFMTVHYYNVCGLVYSFANHIIIRFKVLQHQLKHSRSIILSKHGHHYGYMDSFNNDDDRILHQELSLHLVQCIKYHQDLLEICHKMSEIMSPILFIFFISVILCMCLVTFEASTIPINSPMFLVMVVTCFTDSTNMILVCWFSSELTKQSFLVAQAAYNNDWIDCHQSYKTCINTIITRANKPVLLSAAGVTIMDMETYTRIMEMTFSYFTFLRTMNQD